MEPRTPPPDDVTHSEAPPLEPLERISAQRFGESPGDLIGPFKLLQLLGEGGFGVVWLAERREPMVQRVAIKIIKPGMDSKAVVARFEQERQALAVMDHPNIAKVLDGGVTSNGRPYFVMEYVQGEPITAYCDRHRIGTRERLELFIRVCEAVQHAHQKGLIHRDIKPSNILVTVKDSQVVPKVIDFGVAKAVHHSLTAKTIFTEIGQFIGTPEYMSPEQADMGETDIDTRSDVYSLGVVLYEMLSGLLPFDAASLRSAGFDGIRKVIRDVDPPKPSTRLTSVDAKAGAEIAQSRQSQREALTRELRRELDWIPMKALRKDRTHRYASPADLARDLRNYLDGQPLEAGPESASYRLKKLVRRHRGPVLAGSLVFATLVLGLVGTAVGFLRAEERAEAERKAKEEAVDASTAAREAAEAARRAQAETAKQRDSAEYESYVANVAVASNAIASFEPVRAGASLAACPERMRGWEWRYLSAQLRQSSAILEGHDGEVNCVRFSPDGSRVVTASLDRTARIWDAETGASVAVLSGHGRTIERLAIGPAGTDAEGLVATAALDGSVRVWAIATGELVSEITGHVGEPTALAFDPKRGQLLSADGGGVRLSDPRTGALIRSIAASLEPFEVCDAVYFDGSGERLCTIERGGVSRVWGVESGKELSRFQSAATDSAPIIGAFLGSGEQVLSGLSARRFDIWNAADGTLVRSIGVESIVAAINGRGDTLFSCPFGDSSPSLIDVTTGSSRVRLVGHASPPLFACFSPSDKRVVTTSLDKTTRLWDVASGRSLAVLFGQTGRIRHAAYSPKGDLLATASGDGTARVWNLPFLRGTMTQRFRGTVLETAGFDSTGERMLCRTATWSHACICDATSGSVLLAVGHPGEHISAAAFDAMGQRIVTTASGGPVRVWDAWTGQLLATVGGQCRGRDAGTDATGASVAAMGGPGECAIWDVATERQTVRLTGDFGQVMVTRFSPDGAYVVGGCEDGSLVRWNAKSGARMGVLSAHSSRVTALTFDRSGQRLLSGGSDGTVRLTEASTGSAVGIFRGHEQDVLAARFSPSEDRIVTTSADRTLRIWDPATQRELLTIRGERMVLDACFDATGERLALGEMDLGVRVIESRPMAERIGIMKAAASAEAAMKSAPAPRFAAGEDLDEMVKELVGGSAADPIRRRAALAAIWSERERRSKEKPAGESAR